MRLLYKSGPLKAKGPFSNYAFFNFLIMVKAVHLFNTPNDFKNFLETVHCYIDIVNSIVPPRESNT